MTLMLPKLWLTLLFAPVPAFSSAGLASSALFFPHPEHDPFGAPHFGHESFAPPFRTDRNTRPQPTAVAFYRGAADHRALPVHLNDRLDTFPRARLRLGSVLLPV